MFSAFKRNAKLALKGQWGAAIGTFLVVVGVQSLLAGLEHKALQIFVVEPFLQNPTMEPQPFDLAELTRELLTGSLPELVISSVFFLLTLLLLSPLQLGMTRWYFTLIRGNGAPFSEVFYFFETLSRYGRAVWYTVQLSVRSFLWSLVFFFLPCGVMGISLWFLSTDGISAQTRSAASLGVVMACGLLFLAVALFLIFINRYALVSYLLCESDAITVSAAFKTSVRYTKNHRVMLLTFSLSFIGWFLLAPFTMFLLMLYVVPYYNAATTLLSRYLVEKNRLDEPGATQEWHPIR